MSDDRRLVDVAVPLPVDRTFTYALEEGQPRPEPGSRVLVSFRRRNRIGWVVGPGSAEGVSGIKTVLDVLDDEPSLPPELLELCRWISAYYLSPLGLTIRAALPSVLSDASRDYVSLAERPPEELGTRERRLVDALTGADEPVRVQTLRRRLEMGSIWPEIRSLKARGALRHETVPPQEPSVKTRKVVRIRRWLSSLGERDDVFGRAYRQREAYEMLEASGGSVELAHLTGQAGFSRSVISGLEEKGICSVEDEEVVRDPFADTEAPEPPDLTPTPAQRDALDRMLAAADTDEPLPFLLHGVTGSGKTLVYIELLKELVLNRGMGAVVLVPEISLTPQTVTRFRAHFGDRIAVLHSGLSDGERYDAWRQLRSGEKRIAVGARSAIFAPIHRLGAIVVDEEHDGSYKQSEAPRYHARDLAVVRATRAGAVCVLGSATPSLESWSNVEREKFELLSLPERVAGGRLPPVTLIDLRELRRRDPASQDGDAGEGGERGAASGGGSVLSPPLVEAVNERLERDEQVILLLNRRGYSSFVQCRECGEVQQCRNCSVSLTYHRTRKRVVCHHCGHEEPAPERCPRCGSDDLSFRGLGTEQVERIVTETFPGTRIARMDVDTTSGKWSHHEILGRVERGEVDILLGTQMIAKGLDFPRVTLVGVINADVGLHLPDFRASERTFQLLSQVAGRAGRGTLGGEVLIQTSVPDHYAIRSAVKHDYARFAERELEERRDPAYPPHVRMANVVVSSPDPELAARGAEDGVRWLRRRLRKGDREGLAVVGPAPSPIERLHGRWRWHFLLRTPDARLLGRVARAFSDGFRARGGDVRVIVDRDPTALL